MVFKSWQIDSADSKLAEILQTGLRSVMDPELGLNIIQLGLVRNVEILEDKAHVTMIFTTPFCPYAPQLMETCIRSPADGNLPEHIRRNPWNSNHN